MKFFTIVFSLLVAVSVSANTSTIPKVPVNKMVHKQVFIDSNLQKRRVYKQYNTYGEQIWSKKKKKYVKHGVYYKTRKDGSLDSITTWEYGVKNGKYEAYTKKGKLRQKGSYLKNKKSEEWLWYTKDGRLIYRDQYKNGKKHGTCISYHNSKKKLEREQFVVEYHEGKRHGSYRQYNIKSKKVIWGKYVKGKKKGMWYSDYGFKVSKKNWP